MQTYDEQEHYFRIIQISELSLISDVVTSIYRGASITGPGGYIDRSSVEFAYRSFDTIAKETKTLEKKKLSKE